MFEISKYKKSNVKISIRLPENINETLKKIAKKEDMSFNNVIVSCIQNSLDEMDLSKYKDIELYDNKELKV
jgi:predicted HicB family RNase H-like nuclease